MTLLMSTNLVLVGQLFNADFGSYGIDYVGDKFVVGFGQQGSSSTWDGDFSTKGTLEFYTP